MVSRMALQMVLEQNYHSLARSLVRTHGNDALEYARRNAKESADRNSEAVKIWFHVAKTVERLILKEDRRRRSGRTPLQ